MTLVLPKRWATNDPAELARQLERLTEELTRDAESRRAGSELRFLSLPKVTARSGATIDAPAAFGRFLPVETGTGGTVRVLLPRQRDDRDAGRVCAVIRRSRVGTVTVIPPSGGTIDGASSLALPPTVGWRRLLWAGGGEWFSSDDPDGTVAVTLPDYASASTSLQTVGGVSLAGARLDTGALSALFRVAVYEASSGDSASYLHHVSLQCVSGVTVAFAENTFSTVGVSKGTISGSVSSGRLLVRVTPAGASPLIWSATVEITRGLDA